jgi:hypothetical protein
VLANAAAALGAATDEHILARRSVAGGSAKILMRSPRLHSAGPEGRHARSVPASADEASLRGGSPERAKSAATSSKASQRSRTARTRDSSKMDPLCCRLVAVTTVDWLMPYKCRHWTRHYTRSVRSDTLLSRASR